MKDRTWSNGQISTLCLELATLIHAGVSIGDGLILLAQENGEDPVLTQMARQVDGGGSLSAALADAGRFPIYVSGMTAVGERTGRVEESLRSLSAYYDSRERMDRQVRSALLFPSVVFAVTVAVIVVLLVRVLPIFNEVYVTLGGQLTGVAGGLLRLGRWLDSAMPVLCILAAALAAFLAAFAVSASFRGRMLAWWRRRRGDRGLSRRLNDAQLAQALAMGLRSGLPLEEAVTLASELQRDLPAAQERCSACLERLSAGGELADALQESGLLPSSACRLLALGLRSGDGDSVVEEVARRLRDDSENALEEAVSRVEPALVLCASLLVGVVLLSVMLPLMHILSAIG